MNEDIHAVPPLYDAILKETNARGFTMPSDLKTGSLLKTLAAMKPGGDFLELGTGTGLSTAWILAGMDTASSLITLDNDAIFQEVATAFLAGDDRVTILHTDGEKWIQENTDRKFDFIFADTWPGKYNHFCQTIDMLKKGGVYIVDDMCEQPNWPEGHQGKVAALIEDMDQLADYTVTKMHWSTGIIMLVRQ